MLTDRATSKRQVQTSEVGEQVEKFAKNKVLQGNASASASACIEKKHDIQAAGIVYRGAGRKYSNQ
eukprot:749042-Hanusia_phi.AAC.3